MATYNKFNTAIGGLSKAVNVATDTWKFVLATALAATDTTITAEVANGNGYTTGGNATSVTSSTVSGATPGVMTLILTAPALWTASGAGFSFRYVILYNSTNSLPVGYWDYGSTVTMSGANGDTFQFTPDAVNGVFSET
jgi:hypothetical protein